MLSTAPTQRSPLIPDGKTDLSGTAAKMNWLHPAYPAEMRLSPQAGAHHAD
jgi:hypothetical protein